MHEDHWGTSGIFWIFGLLCIHVAMGTRGRLNILNGVAPFQFGNGYFSVCAQIKINLLIYPTLLGLHTYDPHNTTPGIVAVDLSGKLVAL